MKQGIVQKNFPFWQKETLLKFCHAAAPVCYKRGDTVLHPMMTNRSVYLIESGRLDYRYYSNDGKMVTVHRLLPGELFGVKSLVTEEVEHPKYFFANAGTDLKAWKLSQNQFWEMMDSDPEFSKGIVQYFVYYVTILEKKILGSTVLTHYQHMILTLLDNMENDKRYNSTVVRISQQKLADMLAISRQSVSTYLQNLSKQEIISIKREQIFILDLDALNRELSQEFL